MDELSTIISKVMCCYESAENFLMVKETISAKEFSVATFFGGLLYFEKSVFMDLLLHASVPSMIWYIFKVLSLILTAHPSIAIENVIIYP